MAQTIQPYTAAELHPHTFPPSVLDAAPMLLTVSYVAVRENFRFYCHGLDQKCPDSVRTLPAASADPSLDKQEPRFSRAFW
jgi:hypothetical protein